MGTRGLKDWHKSFFRSSVFSPGQAEALAQAVKETEFARRALGLGKGSRLLDLCCGTGRHSLPLARRGVRIVGLDATPAYLKAARWAADGAAELRFVRGDGSYMLEDAELREGRDPVVVNTWTILRRGRRAASAVNLVRLYDYARLSRLLRRCGLVPVKRWGGLDGASWPGKRLVILARKPR